MIGQKEYEQVLARLKAHCPDCGSNIDRFVAELRAEVERLRIPFMEHQEWRDRATRAETALAEAVELLRAAPWVETACPTVEAWLDSVHTFLAEHGGSK